MNTHMVFYAWGRPDTVNEPASADDTKEEWVYKRKGEKARHLYFEDGLLTAIRD